MLGRAAAASDPTSQSAGQSSAGDVTAASNSAHLAAAPIPPANANSSSAAVTPSVLGGGYAVQVTSERSESGAQAAFRALQAKYPIQLSGRHPIIRRTDLGAAGTYYRALVGPLRSAEEAKRRRLHRPEKLTFHLLEASPRWPKHVRRPEVMRAGPRRRLSWG